MSNFENENAPASTITQSTDKLDDPTDNIYEALAIISKRAEQVGADMKMELHDKLEEFATPAETLEEIFENKEQIEVSRHYESLPKPWAMATEQWKNGKIYFRSPDSEVKES